MNNKTKAIIAVMIVALVLLGVLFVNTTNSVENMFRQVGAFVVAAVIIIAALAAIYLIMKGKKAIDQHELAKAEKKAAKEAAKESEE